MSDDAKNRDKGNGKRDGEAPFSVVDRRPKFEAETGGAEAPSEPRLPTLVEEFKARAEEAERRAREISQAYRRIDEERDAFRERLARDLERRVDIARSDLMRGILPVLDDLDRALAAAGAGGDPATLRHGVSLIRDRLMQALAAEGVEVVATAGQPFDPAIAEAVASVETDDAGLDNRVIEEIEPGYRLRGALLRPARVKVGRRRGPAAGAPDA